jgi:hypothetical protein
LIKKLSYIAIFASFGFLVEIHIIIIHPGGIVRPDINSVFASGSRSAKYVALIDVLGFSSRVLADFDSALGTFERVLESTALVNDLIEEVDLRVYSDSFLLVSDSFDRIVAAAQGVLRQTLSNDYLVRGGIAYGRHFDESRPPNTYLVSEAVVKAAMVEKSVKFPCVAIHPDIAVAEDWWGPATSNLQRGLLYFGGLVLVNPCMTGWGASARTRVEQMLDAHPEHREKYKWFLELHDAIFSPVPMVPPRHFCGVDDRNE